MNPDSLATRQTASASYSNPFEVLQYSTGTGNSFIEVIPSLGGAINRLQLTQSKNGEAITEDLIKSISQQEYENGNPSYKNVLLFPFVNRLDRGQYAHLGKSYQFALNESGLQNSLHGFLFHTPVKVNAHFPKKDEVVVTIHYKYDGSVEAYPFTMDVDVEYRLNDSNGLTVAFNVINLDSQTAPIAIGWHPYFMLRGNSAEWKMKLPEVRHVAVDQRMLPTGHKNAFDTFNKLAKLDGTALDHCFQIDLSRQPIDKTSSTLLWSDEFDYGLEIWQDIGEQAFNYLQVCIPPTRDCIAVEPVSANINAFNNGEGLIQLEPNKRLSIQCGVRLATDKPN